MRLKLFAGLILALLFVCVTCSVSAQSVAAASRGGASLAVGAGFSGYDPSWDTGNLYGGTLWIDWGLPHMPSILKGLNLEVEARDLNYGRSSKSPDLREDTLTGGALYSWHHFYKFRPYGKFIAGFGNRDALSEFNQRYNDNRNIMGGGGGVDYRLTHRIWVRADYEYQYWPDMHFKYVKNVPTPFAPAKPQGFTVGVIYHFSGSR